MNIVFFGNCQFVALHRAYETFVTPHTNDTAIVIDPRRKLTPADWQRLADADLVVDQLTDMKPENTLDQVTFKGRRVAVPAISTAFLWPWTGTPHPDSVRLHGAYNPFQPEMNDDWILRAIKSGTPPDQAVADYLALDAPTEGHVDRRYELEMERQRARDADTGFAATPLIERHFREERLFLTPYHVDLRMMRYLTLTLLEMIGSPSLCLDLVRRHMTNSFSLKFELPVHPAIARHFGLAWANEATRYRFHNEALITFAEYATRVAHCTADAKLDAALLAMAKGEPEAPALLEAAYPHHLPPRRISPWAKRALATIRVREGRLAEAESLLREAIADYPADAPWLTLADCLRRAGRDAEADAAIAREIEHQPYQPGPRFLLANALLRQGRPSEALAQIETALQLAPGRANFVALRDRLSRELALA